MKQTYWVWVLIIAIAAGVGAAAQSQNESLGAYARSIRKGKAPVGQPAKVYDDDNMPKRDHISVVGDAPAPVADRDAQSAPAAEEQKPDAGDDSQQVKSGQSTEERQKALDSWKQRLDEQKSKIDLLSRELNVLQREYQIKSSEFYADTARRVQNPKAFADDDAKYKKQIEDKQKDLDEAKSKLADLRDQARKEGVPNSVME